MDRSPPPSAASRVAHVVASEACERFAFYGTSSILTVYLAQWLLYDGADARAAYHLFQVAAYLTPLLGAWVADRLLGRYRTILLVSALSIAGQGVLALWPTRAGLLLGLSLIALGAGGLKPCLSAFVGDQVEGADPAVLDRIYGWLYWTVNLASAAARVLLPALLPRQGPRVAFAVSGAAVLAGLGILVAGGGRYRRAPVVGPDRHGLARVIGRALRRLGTGRPGEHWLDAARDRHPAEAVEGAKAVLRIVVVFAAVIPFWALFDQRGSSWVLQGRAMPAALGSWTLEAAQLQALDPAFVLVLVPLLGWGIFPWLARRGIDLAPLRKMSAGMFVTVASFVAAALVQWRIDAGQPPHLLWQVPQYALLATGEVLVAVTGLEFSYTQAPRAMRSTILSIWFLTVAAGNLLTAVAAKLVTLRGAGYFWFFAALMLAAALGFRQVAGRRRPAAGAIASPGR